MTVKGATSWSGTFVCKDSTGALAAATVGPAGTLYVNGTANGAAVTITGANPYKFTLTLPALSAGDRVDMYITATVGGIATAAIVASDAADTKRISDLNDIAATAIVSGGAITTAAGAAVANVTQIDGAATNGYNATLKLKQLDIQSGSGDLPAVHIVGNGDGAGMDIQGGSTFGQGILVQGGGLAAGLTVIGGSGNADGADIIGGGTTGYGMAISAAATDGIGLLLNGSGTRAGLMINQVATGPGLLVTTTDGDGIIVTPGGAGHYDINADIHGTIDTTTDVTNVVSANLVQILGTVITETAGQIAAAFKKFFNVAAPTGTVNSIPDALPSAASGLPLKSDLTTAATVNAIADQVWDEAIAGHLAAGSTGLALNTAGAAADPLTNPVPGTYASGTAGSAIGSLLTGKIIVTSPLAQDGLAVKLVRGDDYLNADGRALVWTDSGSNWPNLTGATVRFKWGIFTKNCTVIGAGGAHQQVSLDLTSAETNTLENGTFDLEATLSNTHVVTIVIAGSLIIREDV